MYMYSVLKIYTMLSVYCIFALCTATDGCHGSTVPGGQGGGTTSQVGVCGQSVLCLSEQRQ